MRILLDNCVPRKLARLIIDHDVITVAVLGWEKLADGSLLDAAADVCDVFVTLDKSIPFQQRLGHRPFGVIVLRAKSNRIEQLLPLVPDLLEVLRDMKPGQLREIG